MNNYHLSDAGAIALKNEEGLRLTAYRDANGYTTIGYGHRLYDSNITCVTMNEAQQFFYNDVMLVIKELNSLPVQLNQNEVDSLVSFIFNIGIGAWRGSTARRDLINGHVSAVPVEMQHWVHDSKGRVIPGLVSRRSREAQRFEGVKAA